MRKEIIIAIILGGVLGLLIAFGIWRANSAMKEEDAMPKESSSTLTQTPDNQIKDLKISISEPENFDVVTKSPIQISGLTKEKAIVVLSSEKEDHIILTSNEEFSQEIELVAGINQILISSFLDGSSVKSDLIVVFSSEFENLLSSDDNDDGTSTEEADVVRQKVKEKIDAIRKNPKSYVGALTDKTDDTFQIKNIDGEIQLAAVTDDVTYVKLNGSSSDINFSDVAIGDFISALGFTDGNKVLDTKRVIVSDPIEKNSRTIILGEIKSIDGKSITINDQSGKEHDLIFPKRWKGPEISELSEGEKVVVIYELIDSKNTIRTIEKVENIESN